MRLRHKIEKAVAAKQKKARKESKKNPQWRSKLKKDPGIPNLFPYKNRILAEIEDTRRQKTEQVEKKKAAQKAAKSVSTPMAAVESNPEIIMENLDDENLTNRDLEEEIDESNPMAALLASAKAAAKNYQDDYNSEDPMDQDDNLDENSDISDQDQVFYVEGGLDRSRKAYDKVFKQVVDQADVVLYVLDARDPEGTRSRDIERMVMAAAGGEKRLILIMNKIDLIPVPVLRAWLIHLRRYFPTIPLRASGSAPNARTFNHKQLTVQATSATLFRALKSFASSKQLKRAISVGVIGYPNVGKSSIINTLTSRIGGSGAACPVGAEAGVTTSLREVKIDSKLKILDSPGIIFPSTKDGGFASKKEEEARLILLNAIPPKMIKDPIPAVTLLLKRLSKSSEMMPKLLEIYDLPPLLTQNGDPTMDFLVQVARKRGRLGKGGVPNIHSAAMMVITDWRDGRIPGWTEAPKLDHSSETEKSSSQEMSCDQKKIVMEWAAEFKLEGLWGSEEVAESVLEDSMQE